MFNHVFLMAFLFLPFLIISCASPPKKEEFVKAEEGDLSLIINVANLRCCEGTLLLAVYNNKSYWLEREGMVRGRVSFILKDQEKIEVHGLPAGKYAVAIHQDINFNKKLDRYLGLIPKEPYGFSNNVGKYGPVSFEKASFSLVQDKEITIKMIDH